MEDKSVYIVSAVRTAIGNFNGTLSQTKASQLGSVVIEEVLKRGNVEGKDVNEIIVGQTLTAGQGQNPARQAALGAGIPIKVPAYTINMLCGSGLKSVVLGYQSIRCGDSDIVISIGQENMSLSPHCMHMRDGVKMGNANLIDTMLSDGLTDAMKNIHMGITAENLAAKYEISKEQQDEFATKSQNLCENSQKSGFFNKEIVPVIIKTRKGNISFETDEFPKHGTTTDKIAPLKPCFINNGTVTPGNASGIGDSASAVLLISGKEALKRNSQVLAKIVAWAQSGCEPEIMGIGPVDAVNLVLTKAGWTKDDVDIFELNEAFAAQAIAVNTVLEVNPEKVNINGGAIALGHPIGASGNRILVTLLYALERINGKRGIAALCVGGGMGIAMAIERVV